MNRRLQEMVNERLTYLRRRLPQARDGAGNPHAKLIVEALALLNAQTQLEIEQRRAEVHEGMTALVLPHLLTPVPALAIARCEPGPELGEGQLLPRGTILHSPQGLGGNGDRGACEFQTASALDVWPIRVEEARYDSIRTGKRPARAEIHLRLGTINGVRFADLAGLDTLRFYLGSEDEGTAWQIYQALFACAGQPQARPAHAGSAMTPAALRAVGFDKDEALLAWGNRTFAGFRLLAEYFAFPHKFLFAEVTGLAPACRAASDTLEIVIPLDRELPSLERLSAVHFALGCTVVSNISTRLAESVEALPTQAEHRLVIDPRRPHVELSAVEGVEAWDRAANHWLPCPPLYGYRHSYGSEEPALFWHLTRRPAADDGGTQAYLTLVNTAFQPEQTPPLLRVRVRCTDGDLPARLAAGAPLYPDDPEIRQGGDALACRLVATPTPSLRPTQQGGNSARLASYLALNQLALCEPDEVAPFLRRLLGLHALTDWETGNALRSREAARRARVTRELSGLRHGRIERAEHPSAGGQGVWHGRKMIVELDDDAFPGSAPLLFASCLERFFSLAAPVNSFARMVLTTPGGLTKSWQPSIGERNIP